MQIYKAHFGKILDRLLREKDIKQYKLAEKLGIEPPNVSRWVNGVNFPEEPHFQLLCEVLEVSPSVFIGDQTSGKSDLVVDIVATLPALNESQLEAILKLARRLANSSGSLDQSTTG